MVDTNSHVYPIQVGFRSLSGQTRQLLDYYFNSSGADWFRSASDPVDCLLVDIDYPGSREILEENSDGKKLPILVLSFKPQSQDNIVNLIKPLTLHKLELAAKEIAVLVAKRKGPAPDQHIAPSSTSQYSRSDHRSSTTAIDKAIGRAMELDQADTDLQQIDSLMLYLLPIRIGREFFLHTN